jgi:hypothetical protein
MSRTEVPDRIRRLHTHFDRYVAAFDQHPPFTAGQLAIHQRVIALRRQLGSAERAIASDVFLQQLHELLKAWGMASRGARLAEPERFRTSIRRRAEDICRLEPFTIAASGTTFADLIPDIIAIIQTLDVNDNHTKVVVGSKTLHHLLPDLIPPMDGAYTGTFFAWPKPYFRHRQGEILHEGLTVCNRLARSRHPERLVGAGWRTSATKILDNAIVAYCRVESLVCAA